MTICSSHCKHYGRCDHEPGVDCFEPRPIPTLCARALIEGNDELRLLALTLHRLENQPLANRLALHAMELKDSGLVL